jgi:hypothetical protein
MSSPSQIMLPLWAVLCCCFAPPCAMLTLVAANIFGKTVEPITFGWVVLACCQTTRWVLRVPPKQSPIVEPTQNVINDQGAARPSVFG